MLGSNKLAILLCDGHRNRYILGSNKLAILLCDGHLKSYMLGSNKLAILILLVTPTDIY
jgi:hypothetical protein